MDFLPKILDGIEAPAGRTPGVAIDFRVDLPNAFSTFRRNELFFDLVAFSKSLE